LRESIFQAHLIKELYRRFPGCIVLKNDPEYIQGIPDLTILWHDKWAALELKTHAGAKRQPNQDHYIGYMNDMSFAAFIYPENEEEVLRALQLAFQPRRTARVS
jgi:hypothetical protein